MYVACVFFSLYMCMCSLLHSRFISIQLKDKKTKWLLWNSISFEIQLFFFLLFGVCMPQIVGIYYTKSSEGGDRRRGEFLKLVNTILSHLFFFLIFIIMQIESTRAKTKEICVFCLFTHKYSVVKMKFDVLLQKNPELRLRP